VRLEIGSSKATVITAPCVQFYSDNLPIETSPITAGIDGRRSGLGWNLSFGLTWNKLSIFDESELSECSNLQWSLALVASANYTKVWTHHSWQAIDIVPGPFTGYGLARQGDLRKSAQTTHADP
jgi:hypothetical protein